MVINYDGLSQRPSDSARASGRCPSRCILDDVGGHDWGDFLKVRGARREDLITVWLNREYVEISTEFHWCHREPTIDKPQRLGKTAQAAVAKGEGEIKDMQFRWSLIPLRKFSTMCFAVAEIRVRLGQGNLRRRAAGADRRRGRVR